MMKGHSHLSDDELIELYLAGATEHGCPACEARRADLAALMADISDAAVDEADALFPADRLARQQARILGRLEQDGRPGRVIAFPSHSPDGPLPRTRPAARWIAAAAAAGLVIGLLAGHLAHDMPGRAAAPAVGARVIDAPPQPALRAVATTFSEDEFLVQIDQAADSPGGLSLRSLHEATPRAWEDIAK